MAEGPLAAVSLPCARAWARFEAMREGLQECEARLAIEEKKPEEPLLLRRTGCAWLLPGGTQAGKMGEFYGGWQERSAKLCEAAAVSNNK